MAQADRGARGPSPSPSGIDLTLPRTAEAPALARAATRDLCSRLAIGEGRCQTLLVLVSEVVTNAVRHSDATRAGILFSAAETGDRALRIDVDDGGSGFEPRPRDPSEADRGWGLFLVDRESLRWGVDVSAGTRVWFEFASAGG